MSNNWFTRCISCFSPADLEVDGSSAIRDDGRSVTNMLTRRNFDNRNLWRYEHEWTAASNFDFAVTKDRPEVTQTSIITGFKLIEGGVVLCICESHGSAPVCATYVQRKMMKAILEAGSILTMSEDDLTNAFIRVEAAWVQCVSRVFNRALNRFTIWAAAGTSCLVGIIVNGRICLANVGDSRVVIQTLDEMNNRVPIALTTDDNINDPTVRETVLAEHQEEPDYLVQDNDGTYFIKGKSQLSKSLGDAFLKLAEYNLDNDPMYRLNTPLTRPALSAMPYTAIRAITAQDDFIIFASQELWRIMSQQEVVFIVRTCPREGIAATVIRHALAIVAQRNNMSYQELQQTSRENVTYHNEIAAAIIFFRAEGEDIEMLDVASASTEGTSYSTALENDLQDMTGLEGRDVIVGSSRGEGHVGSSSGGGDLGSSSGGGGGDIECNSDRTEYFTALEEMENDLDP